MNEDYTPHPGSRMDATARAAEAEAPAVPAEPTGLPVPPEYVVPVRFDTPTDCIPRTLILSATNPVLPVMPRDLGRWRAIITPAVNPVYITESPDLADQILAQVLAGSTAVQTMGAWLPAGTGYPLQHKDVLYAVVTTVATVSPVSVITERYAWIPGGAA